MSGAFVSLVPNTNITAACRGDIKLDKNCCSSAFAQLSLRRCQRLSFAVDNLKPHRLKHTQTC